MAGEHPKQDGAAVLQANLHAARSRGLARRLDDGVVASVEAADDVFGAAVGHGPVIRKTEP